MAGRGEHVHIDGTEIEDEFAEAFTMYYARLVVTAGDDYWLDAAVAAFCGYGSSVIGCDAETGRDVAVGAEDTPDGRPGMAVMAFGISIDSLAAALRQRVGQCLMTCPTTAVYDGNRQAIETVPLGAALRYFGDGFQKSKLLASRRYWRIPVMDGEFVVEHVAGIGKGIGGGNFIIQAPDPDGGLQAARRAVQAIERVEGVILPFPGGVARSGSKVGSRYRGVKASTNQDYCPTLRGRVESRLHPDAELACEIVVDGIDAAAVTAAIRAGVTAACGNGVLRISAGNFGGKLGKHHFHLRQVLNP